MLTESKVLAIRPRCKHSLTVQWQNLKISLVQFLLNRPTQSDESNTVSTASHWLIRQLRLLSVDYIRCRRTSWKNWRNRLSCSSLLIASKIKGNWLIFRLCSKRMHVVRNTLHLHLHMCRISLKIYLLMMSLPIMLKTKMVSLHLIRVPNPTLHVLMSKPTLVLSQYNSNHVPCCVKPSASVQHSNRC